MTEKILGIDLGTTNSEIALYQSDGGITVFAGPEGRVLPSCVGFDDKGRLLVGEAALNQLVLYPERTIRSVKRLMGESDRILLGDQSFLPQEIAAMILRRLKEIAETELGFQVDKAVITVPAFFSDAQRQATREAGEMAGLEVVRIINEPTAATLLYESNCKEAKKVLVYDLGGGTFDVSLVQLQDGVIEVIASHGNNRLGGDDFDTLIEKRLLQRLKEEKITTVPPQAAARIRRAAEAGKKQLSSDFYARFAEEYLLEQNGTPYHLEMELSRTDYEELITPLVDETFDAVHRVLRDAGLPASALDEVVLVGGSTRTPLIQARLEQELGLAPRFEMDPDLCVASGAALQGALIGGEELDAVLVDITPYTFGTSALGDIDGELFSDMFVPLIKKNSPIPITCSESFATVHDFQEGIEVKVYQGEEANALDNVEVGSFFVHGLSHCPAPNQIILKFALDINGILQVKATEQSTGLEKSITINNALSEENRTSLETAREQIEQLFAPEGEAQQSRERSQAPAKSDNLKVQAEALMDKARSLFDQAGEEDREDMIEVMENITLALKAGEAAAISTAMEELADIIFYLEP